MTDNSLYLQWEKTNDPKVDLSNSIFKVKEKINYIENKSPSVWINKLYWGNCNNVLRSTVESFKGEIKMIYIDPPYALDNTGFTKRIKTTNFDHRKVPGTTYEEYHHRKLWKKYLHSYLNELRKNFLLMRQLLQEDGVLFVHMDPQISHYVKLLLDSIFKNDNFQGEIVWNTACLNVAGFKTQANNWIRGSDVILVYSKSEKFEFNKIETNQNIWNDILSFNYVAAVRYETRYFNNQKPENLMKRIIQLSTDEGDLIADFYCGSGTTFIVAEKLKRSWLGGDISKDAIEKTKRGLLCVNKKKAYELKEYTKECRPFEVYDCSKFITRDMNKNAFDLLIDFIIDTYDETAIAIDNYGNFQARKNEELIYIGNPISPLTSTNIQESLDNLFQKNNRNELKEITKLIFLGWEFEIGLDLFIRNQIKSLSNSYEIELKRISRDAIDHFKKGNPMKKDIVDLNDFKYEIELNKNSVEIEITDFEFNYKDFFRKTQTRKMENALDWINYWGVDFYYKDKCFNNCYNSYRIKDGKNDNLDFTCSFKYENEGEHKVLIRVIDVLGNDTNKLLIVNNKSDSREVRKIES